MKTLRIDAPAKRFAMTENETGTIYRRVISDLEAVRELFEERYQQYETNLRYYKGQHWTAEEVAAFQTQFRHHYSFNEILNKVEHICGQQTQTRLDAKVYGRESGDQSQVELLNFLLKWCEQINDLEYCESEIFKDALLSGAGAALVRWESADIYQGHPKVERVPIYELFWDVDSTDISLSDARWMSRVTVMSKMRAAEAFPQWVDAVDKAGVSSYYDPFRFHFATKRRQHGRIYHTTFQEDDSREWIRIIEHYERVQVYTYLVHDGLSGNSEAFETYKEAEQYYEGLIAGYMNEGVNTSGQAGEELISIAIESRDRIIQTLVIGDQVVHRDVCSLPTFPYVVCFAFFHDGGYWGFVDQLIDPQVMVNRYLTQWDYQLGTSVKNAVTVMETLLRRGWDIEDVRRELAKTAPVIPVLNHQAITPMQRQAPDAALFQGIDLAIGRMNDFVGGKNSLGLVESSQESGRAVLHRPQAVRTAWGWWNRARKAGGRYCTGNRRRVRRVCRCSTIYGCGGAT